MWVSLQVNPLAETTDGRLVAADAKLGFDDNAAFRQKELFAKRDSSQEDPRCLHAPPDMHMSAVRNSDALLTGCQKAYGLDTK